MAWPPPALPTTRTNTTVQFDTHPADHNAVNLAVNDIVAHVQGIDTYLTSHKPKVWTARNDSPQHTLTPNAWDYIPVGTLTLPAGIVWDVLVTTAATVQANFGGLVSFLGGYTTGYVDQGVAMMQTPATAGGWITAAFTAQLTGGTPYDFAAWAFVGADGGWIKHGQVAVTAFPNN
jgi:hypothetical protein